MFFGLNKFFKRFLPKGLFYRSLIIVAAPTILLQLIVTIVFFDSIWIKANKGMTRSLVSEIKTLSDVYNSENKRQINNITDIKTGRQGTAQEVIDYINILPLLEKMENLIINKPKAMRIVIELLNK